MREIEYTVVDADDLNKLASDVTAMLIEGYEPQGGIAVGTKDGKPLYCQALVKRDD